MKKTIISTLAVSMLSFPAFAEDLGSGVDLSANAALSTDYIWRGVSQTGGHPAFSGGFDLSHASGLYLGNWNSNVNYGDGSTSLEMDFYGGISNSLFGTGVNYDAGAIGYVYPGADELNFYEIYLGASTAVGPIEPELKGYYDPDNENWYVDATAAISLPYEVTIAGHYGVAVPKEGEEINDFLVGVSRPLFGVDLGLSYTDSELDQGRVVVSVSKSF